MMRHKYSNISFIVLFIFVFSVSQLWAGSVNLSWRKPVSDSTGAPLESLSGYRIYYGVEPRTDDYPPGGYSNYVIIDNPDQVSYTLTGLSNDRFHYFSVTAFNSAGESDFSDEISQYICSNGAALIDSKGSFTSIQNAYESLNERESLKIHAGFFTVNLLLDELKNVAIIGGFNCAYTHKIGYSVINGNIYISRGSALLENIIIR